MKIFIIFLFCLAIANVSMQSDSKSLVEKIKQTHILDAKNYESLNDQTVKRKKNYILCNASDKSKNVCFNDSFNFTFSAVFHDKNLNKASSIKHLAQTLADYSTCEVKYMKYDPIELTMKYFKSDEDYLWYQGKKLNHTYRPVVFIGQPNLNLNRKITFKCDLPKSDVELSMNGVNDYKSIQSHPASSVRATVSAIHVKLNFMHIEDINIYSSKYTSSESDKDDFKTQFETQNLIQQSSEKYLIYYDDKCKNCSLNEPFYMSGQKNTLTCLVNTNTCEVEGKCYAYKEKSTANMFVCNPQYSQAKLYMPCAENNGGCQNNQTCDFDADTFKITCQ